MTPFEAYETYLAVKLHFEQVSYDYFRFNGKTRVKPESFEKRKDRYFFEKAAHALSKEQFVARLLVQIRTSGSQVWIKDIFHKENLMKTFVIEDYWKRYAFKFGEDLSTVKDHLLIKNVTFAEQVHPKVTPHGGEYPFVFKKYYKGEFLPEFLIGLDRSVALFTHWQEGFGEDPVWGSSRVFLLKYKPFIENHIPEKSELRKIIVDKLAGL